MSTGCKSYFREFFNGSQFQNCWELSLQIWVGRSLNIPFEVIQNNFLIPATIIEKFRFSQERCRTCRAPCFLNLSGKKPEFWWEGLFPARYFRHQIHKHNQIFTKLGSLMDMMVPHYPLTFWQIHPTDNQETSLFKLGPMGLRLFGTTVGETWISQEQWQVSQNGFGSS